MDLVSLVLVIALVGLLVYLIITYIPMPPIFKVAIQLITVIGILYYLIDRFGSHLPNLLGK